MPIGDPTRPIPESDMRFLRPIGLVLAALFIGFNGSWLLLSFGESMGGPSVRDWALPVACVSSAVVFVLLLRRSRRTRGQAAQLAARGVPPPSRSGRIMFAGVLAVILGGVGIWFALAEEPTDLRGIALSVFMLMAGVASIAAVVRGRRAGPETP